MYHGDLPQPLDDIGGWPNPVLADFYADYAKVAFREFGDRVSKTIMHFALLGKHACMIHSCMKLDHGTTQTTNEILMNILKDCQLRTLTCVAKGNAPNMIVSSKVSIYKLPNMQSITLVIFSTTYQNMKISVNKLTLQI